MPNVSRFNEDDSDYDPTDSDEDYAENEKILNKVLNRESKDSDSEGEVLGVGSASDDSDQSDIAQSDVEGQEDQDDLPDIRAWGKKKNKFYNTDYVDQDYGGFQGKDAHLAQIEEEEARNLQQQLVKQLDDDDFQLDVTSSKKVEEDDKVPEEIIKSDISTLSKRQKLQILQKESPEFFGLVEDFQVKMTVVRDYLGPVLRKYKKGEIQNSSGIEFVMTHHQLIMNYCINIYMYLLLKGSRVNVQNHPVIKRLHQYRQLLLQMEPVFEEVVKTRIVGLLEETTPQIEKPKKTLNLLTQLTEKKEKSSKKKKRTEETESEQPQKKVKFDDEVIEHDASDPEETVEMEEKIEEGGKRPITYQIAKNKGLTPHRKREQRNPRVKHRNKFRKANIRRRGAVREPRTEMTRYGGEISGIKTTVKKGRKIK